MIRHNIPSISFLFFGIFLIFYSQKTLNDFESFGAAFMPTLSGIGLIFFSLIDLKNSLNKKKIKKPTNDFRYVLLISFIVILYIILSNTLGFIITGVITTTPLMMKFSKQNKLKSILISFFLVLFIYYIFAKVLLVPLPHL